MLEGRELTRYNTVEVLYRGEIQGGKELLRWTSSSESTFVCIMRRKHATENGCWWWFSIHSRCMPGKVEMCDCCQPPFRGLGSVEKRSWMRRTGTRY